MPKTNNATGATYAGSEGIVEHAAPLEDGRTLSELDPERNLDGFLVEGERPDAKNEERDVDALQADPTEVRPVEEAERDEEHAEEHGEEEPSPGNSSGASPKRRASSMNKK